MFLPYNKHVINRAKSVCMGESWPRSVLTTSVNILPYKPPAQLIRAKYYKIHEKMAIVYNVKQVLSEILISYVLIARSQIFQGHSSSGLKCCCMNPIARDPFLNLVRASFYLS